MKVDRHDVKRLLGERIRSLRKRLGVSQEAFAHLVCLDRSYIGGVERGERNISIENVWLICQGLGVDLRELLTFDATPKPTLSAARRREHSLSRSPREVS